MNDGVALHDIKFCSKVFDSVDCSILLRSGWCLYSRFLEIIYPSDRWQPCVTYVYWPILLFSLFVNDLPNAVDQSCVNMHDDDTELHCSGNDLQQVQHDLQSDICQIQTCLLSVKCV